MTEYSICEELNSEYKYIRTLRFEDVEPTEQNSEGARYEIMLSYVGDTAKICPVCGSKMHSHGRRSVKYTDTTFMGCPAKLVVDVPRTRCINCGHIWAPSVPAVDENHMMTSRVYSKIANLALKRSFSDISNEYGISKMTAKSVFVEYLKEKNEQLRFKTPVFIGLDEIKIKKLGELTVITDLEHKTLYDMLQGRNQEQLTKYFFNMPDRELVEWVCTDMYRPFEKSIKEAFPNARWVIDHYHIVVYANRAMDALRIHLQAKMSDDDRIWTKKGLAYTLRTRRKRLTKEDAAKIRECRESEKFGLLAVAYDLKEDFFDIYDNNAASRDNAERDFKEWEARIPKDEKFDDFRKLAKTVHNYYDQIFNYWTCPSQITNGFTECTNRIIRETSVRGRGSSFEILRGRTLYRYTNMERLEKNGMLIGPPIPAKGPVFHYEEVKGIEDKRERLESEIITTVNYDDPMIGLVPGINFDPETGEIFDETILEDWDADLK